MDLAVTNTFKKTNDAYHDKLTSEEYAERCRKYIANDIPQIPSQYRYRQIVNVGGSRSSKSYSILQLLMLELITRKKIKITVWRNLKNVCRATVLEDFQEIIMFNSSIYKNFKENKQHGSFTYIPTGSKIVFEGADNIGKVLGSKQDISFFNEVSEFNYDVYLQITQRTSDRIFADYNPSKDFWLEKYRFDDESIFLHSTFKDNRFCPSKIVKQIFSYEPWESGTYEIVRTNIYYNGKPISQTNQPPRNEENYKKGTASEFMWLVYGLGIQAEKPNRIYKGWHKITQDYFNNLPYTSYFGADFGTVNPTAFVEVKYNGDGAFYVCPRYYKPMNEISDSLPTVVHLKIPMIAKGRSLVVCDSAKDKYIELLRNSNYMAVGAIKGGGSVELGITVIQGLTIYFVVTEEFLMEYINYSWSLDRYGKPTDIPMKSDDHYMDAMRYVITYLIEFLGIKL